MTRTIAQRELRNDNAKVIEAVTLGETFLITRNGEPVSELRPVQAASRRFVAERDLVVVAGVGPSVDGRALLGDLDGVVDQRL